MLIDLSKREGQNSALNQTSAVASGNLFKLAQTKILGVVGGLSPTMSLGSIAANDLIPQIVGRFFGMDRSCRRQRDVCDCERSWTRTNPFGSVLADPRPYFEGSIAATAINMIPASLKMPGNFDDRFPGQLRTLQGIFEAGFRHCGGNRTETHGNRKRKPGNASAR